MAFTAMELFAKLAINKDEFDKGMDDAVGTAQSAGSAIGRGVAVAGAAAGAAIGAVATGVANLTVQAVQGYGEFEQLTGGIEKLYGDAADAMVEHANEAFATTGMDANSYMQSVTSFSAALINSLDGDVDAAAEIADMAMRDLADNANTFGTMTAEELTSVYTGLARGNFTLLDNLNLGFAGTQQGMIDLINTSGIFEEEIDSLDGISLDQMYMAIHEVQTQLSITGVTASEAAGTIQGSINMMQASWQNLVTGLADPNADLGLLIGNMVESARAVIQNVIPAATQALGGIATLIEQVAPMITAELPGLVDTILPPLLSAAIQITTALVSALPSILSAISRAIPQALNQLIPAILSVTPLLISAGGELLMGMMQGIIDNADLVVGAITDVIDMLATEVLTAENIETFLNLTLTLIEAVAGAILENAPLILESVISILVNCVDAIIGFIPDLLSAGGSVIQSLADLVADGLQALFGDTLAYWLSFFVELNQKVTQALVEFGTILLDGINTLLQPASDLISDGLDYWITIFSNGFNSIKDTIENILNGVLGTFGSIFDNIKNVVTDAINYILEAFDFEWRLPEIQLPHFSISGGVAPWGFGGEGQLPSVSVEWYKKAYDQPFILNDPTIFGYGNGKFLGGGDGNGGEIVMGYNQLLDAISKATNQTIVVPVYIGGEQIDEFVVNSNQRYDFISGGRG